MAVPKRKTTKSRTGKRRSHMKHRSKNIIEDKNQESIDFLIIWILKQVFIKVDK